MTTPARVLICEDELLVADDLKQRLIDMGYDVVATVASGPEAVQLAGEQRPDLVLMDVRLQGDMDGIQAAERIRAGSGIPVVYLTAYADDDTLKRAKITQPFGYILKPFEVRELRTAIEMALYQHDMERRLQEREQWLSATLTSIGDAVIATDAQARVTFMNPVSESLTGWTQTDALGVPLAQVFALVDDSTRRPIDDPAMTALRTGRPVNLGEQALLVARDGRAIPVEDCAAPIVDAAGRVDGTVVVFHDVTERRRAEAALREGEDRLRRAQKAESLSRLAGGVAHGFNNLLVAVLGQSSLALTQLPHDSAARPHIEKAISAAERAASLSRQMLTYAGQGLFQIRLIDLNACFRETRALFEAGLPKHVVLRAELADAVPAFEGDPAQVQQAMANLILNAAEAIGERPGAITLATGTAQVEAGDERLGAVTGEALAAGRYVTLTVRDDGSGMDEDTLGQIFDPFFTTKFTGRGLGLPAVLGIMRGHRGGIQVDSRAGAGSAFTLYFPASDRPAVFGVEAAAPATQVSGVILVIDDEEPVRVAVTDILELEGLSVISAPNGQEGAALYRQRMNEVRLVILDLSMPGWSGGESFREMRAANPAVRVVLSSGYSESEATRRFVGYGLAGFIQKPYDATTLIREVRRHLV